MQTEGVLVIDTGEIQNRNGETEEPARNIIRQGDYIISFNGEKISTKRELIDDISELDGTDIGFYGSCYKEDTCAGALLY